MQPGCIASTDERLPQNELEQTEFYADWLCPQGIFRSIGGIVFKEGGKVIRLGLPRSKRQGSFEKAAYDRVRLLAPHIQRALRLQNRLSNVSWVLDASSDLLERLPFGVFFVDERGRVVFLSRLAGDMIGAGDGLALDGDGLHALDSSDDDALQRLLRDVVDTASGVGQGAGGSLVLPRASGRRPYQVVVTPLARRRGMFNRERPVAAVLVPDPEDRPGCPQDMLTGVYGLTRKEAALAALLVIGDCIESAAEQLGMTKDTARKHFQRIYRKTGVTRQAGLVTLLLSSPEWLFRDG
jgi:DNA-binding CsgD family transcriptional regulator